ncbi:MAG TPA: HPF/RaiA family ribosome-associated protein [Marmoricola sp.]|nr:HPF/RaiA family ribosome-associated protein [Marmoricola sp.]
MPVSTASMPIEVTLRGNVGEGAGRYARTKVAKALSVAHRPVRRAHVVLEFRHDPALEHKAAAEATAVVDGTTVRAKAAAATMPEAVDELEYRLRRRLVQLQERSRDRHRWTGVATAHEWRHGDLPRRPVAGFPRPPELREVVRRKSFASAPMTVDEAAYEMDLLDHDFFLYLEVGSGTPAVVHRTAGGRYGVSVAGGAADTGEAGTREAGALVREPGPPRLSEAEARTRLEADGETWVFYLDATTGEGRVLYLRYDGDYGVVSVAT